MDKDQWLVERFEAHRSRLRTVAYRLLGSLSDADDAVQEAWLRLHRSDTSGVGNVEGWLTTVVARVCLDMLRSRTSRREEPLGAQAPERVASPENSTDPEHETLLVDSVGLALLVVLDTLAPAERLAFVLHDLFAVPFHEIAPIVDRSNAAARQLASRARRRVQGAATVPNTDRTRQREVVDAFFAAVRDGDFTELLAVLDPDVVVRADRVAAPGGGPRRTRGAPAVGERALTFTRHASFAQLALINGSVGVVVAPGGRLRGVLEFTITGGKIVEIDVIAEPTRLRQLDLAVLD